jgi:hypothetical protein
MFRLPGHHCTQARKSSMMHTSHSHSCLRMCYKWWMPRIPTPQLQIRLSAKKIEYRDRTEVRKPTRHTRHRKDQALFQCYTSYSNDTIRSHVVQNMSYMTSASHTRALASVAIKTKSAPGHALRVNAHEEHEELEGFETSPG